MKTPGDVWSDLPFLVALGAASTLTYVANWMPFAGADPADRAGFYGAGSELVAVLGGLGAIAVAAYGGGGGRGMARLRREQGAALRGNLAWTLAATFVAAALCWLGQGLEAVGAERVAWLLVSTGVLLAALTCLRQVWLFVNLLQVSDRDSASGEPQTVVADVHPRWTEPTSGRPPVRESRHRAADRTQIPL